MEPRPPARADAFRRTQLGADAALADRITKHPATLGLASSRGSQLLELDLRAQNDEFAELDPIGPPLAAVGSGGESADADCG